MTTQQTLLLIAAAVLVFWAVGAYNRLVRLRHAISASFVGLETQITQRHALLLRWTEALRPVLGDSAVAADAVRAAAEQVVIATERARLRPSAARIVSSLRLAEDTLAAARARLVAELPAHLNQSSLSDASLQLAGFQDELAAAGSTLAFARRQFNEAADQYNEAVLQFPTVLIASLFGFHAAGPL
jgi:LemA protein